jgi:hypothetical protein
MDVLLSNEEISEELNRLRGENFHLRRQLSKKNNLINAKDKYIRKLERELKEYRPKKQHYKNGKRGTNKNG